MAVFVAYKAVDMSNLSQLAAIGKWSGLQVPNTIIAKSQFTGKGDGFQVVFNGTGLTVLGEQPVGGTVTAITVKTGGSHAYQLTNIDVLMFELKSTFKGSLGKEIFNKNDQITGSAKNDKLLGFGGNDKIAGHDGKDVIKGQAGNDTLAGNGGNDNLQGMAGNDVLNGGAGVNTLSGGTGKDQFQFNSKVTGANIGNITDFNLSADLILLSTSVFKGFGPKGAALNPAQFITGAPVNGDPVIIYNKAAGTLSLDADGNGGGAAVQFASVQPNLNLNANDFLLY